MKLKNNIVKIACFLSFGVFSIVSLNVISLPAKAITTNISQKEEYYNEYKKIVDNAKDKYQAKIELKPIEQIDEDKLLTPKELENVLNDIGSGETKVKQTRENGIRPEIRVNSKNYEINVIADFDTQLSDGNYKRQFLDNVRNINSNGTGWEQTDSSYNIYDGYRAVDVIVVGNLTIGNIKWYDKKVKITYDCNSYGEVVLEER